MDCLSCCAVYSSCRGLVEVLPLLNLTSGEVGKLAHFKLSLKHPIRNVMELCLSLSTNNAILPVLLSLMVHSQGDNSKKHFQVNKSELVKKRLDLF